MGVVPIILIGKSRALFCLAKIPVLSTEKNVTMLSGYNPVALNIFCEKGVEALQEFTPMKMFKDILDDDRYKIMNDERILQLAMNDTF